MCQALQLGDCCQNRRVDYTSVNNEGGYALHLAEAFVETIVDVKGIATRYADTEQFNVLDMLGKTEGPGITRLDTAEETPIMILIPFLLPKIETERIRPQVYDTKDEWAE